MAVASELVSQTLKEQGLDPIPPRVGEFIDRHRQTLVNLANALILAGRGEDEVLVILQKASESFSIELKTNMKGLQS
ncbi:MAG TPA: hypothetical protein VLA64_15605 [Azonexus sp.]|nr:hypothetical protein [Azonexus sp.]